MRTHIGAKQFLAGLIAEHAHHGVVYIQEAAVGGREKEPFLDAVEQLAIFSFRLAAVCNVLQDVDCAFVVVGQSGAREVDTRKIRSADAATYSSLVCSVSRQKGQGKALPVSAMWRRLLMASPTSATGGRPRWDASERFVLTIRAARSWTTM